MSAIKESPAITEEELKKIPTCQDLDEDCPDVEDHLACWMYDMGKGRCPFCSSCRK